MAAGDAPDAQPGAFEQSMFFQGFYGIMRAAGGKPAAGTQGWGDDPLVNLDQGDEGETQYS